MDPVSVGIWGVQFLLHNHSALYLARLEIKEHLTEGEMLNVKKKKWHREPATFQPLGCKEKQNSPMW